MEFNYREEEDSIGKRQVPIDAYYGVQSLRAYENFRITGRKVHQEFIKSIAEVKKAAAMSNGEVGVFGKDIADAIVSACQEIIDGKLRDQFIVDAIQGGAGTSLNMNANEVIANRAIEIMGGKKGDYSIVHPNDHVNCGQSTNDAYPSAGKIAVIRLLQKNIVELKNLHNMFLQKANEFKNVLKMGRTEMQDAVPMTFEQVFNSYASAIERDIKRFELAITEMSVLNMGGTAIGTGINADKEYIKKVVPCLAEVTNLPLVQTKDLIDGTQNLDCFVYVSSILKTCASNISKIANDLRLMSSGPRAGFGEINLPPKQNGSSIMPGKINPVIPEVVSQIAFNVIGNDTTITLAAESGQLELNPFEPIIFYCLFESLDTLCNGINVFTNECIAGITINVEKCKNDVERNIGIVTALCPYIGYKESARIAKKAKNTNKTIREIIEEEGLTFSEDINTILDPLKMI